VYNAAGMDSKAIKRAALMTLRRAMLERFPPGRERTAWLRWLRAQRRPPSGEARGRPKNVRT